ncbi:general transcription factor 3C polypeptide 5-like, partial [Littorina saxatilis]|uniref:general transcription factor 3C polypeptide 5-like n=1 Tax=Littorina saxatilis TaxID=31220 RepID=UPI0038B477BC
MAAQQTTSSECRLFNSEERMSVAVGDKHFVCIEYPGIVQNVDKALQTLGGLKSISKSIDDPKIRLPLRFRPDDLYSKPTYGTCNKTAGLVIRVRRRKKKPQGDAQESVSPSGSHGDADSSQEDDGYEYKVDILGTVSSSIKFE